jgi:RNA polymerase sigma-70 factor (ECF subfamily)
MTGRAGLRSVLAIDRARGILESLGSVHRSAAVPIPSTHVSLLCELCDVKAGGRRDEAWAVFQARYRGVILGWCLRRGLSPDGAEDLTQDVLLKLFQQLPQFKHDPSRGRFRGWLKAVVNNALTDFWRRQRRRPERGGVGGTSFVVRLGELASPEPAGELSDTIEEHARTTAAEILDRVRAKVKETTWQAFYQSMVERRPAAAVAAALKLSVASVYKANYRIKQMLQEEYRHAYDPRGDPEPLPGPADAGETPA